MVNRVLGSDTQAILLLCGRLGQAAIKSCRPLNLREYNNLAEALHRNGMRPGDLLRPDRVKDLQKTKMPLADPDRLVALLARGAALALAVESWGSKGIWVLSRAHSGYPHRLKKKLGHLAPPILYGIGDKTLLSDGGLAVVGSRDVDSEGLDFTSKVVSICARQDIQIISGGARGVDRKAMESALGEGGNVICVLANNLARAAVSRQYRVSIMEGSLVLVSPYDPDAGFAVGRAMGRNKHMYALSDWALVVSSSSGKGGTWAGATENLKRKWTPLFVRSGDMVPDGNRHLMERGGTSMPSDVLSGEVDLREWFARMHVQSNSKKMENVRYTAIPRQLALREGEPSEPYVEAESPADSGRQKKSTDPQQLDLPLDQ